jgi:hypothetical protein
MVLRSGKDIVETNMMRPFYITRHVVVYPYTSIKINVRKFSLTLMLPLLKMMIKNGF